MSRIQLKKVSSRYGSCNYCTDDVSDDKTKKEEHTITEIRSVVESRRTVVSLCDKCKQDLRLALNKDDIQEQIRKVKSN